MGEAYHEALVELRELTNEVRAASQDVSYGYFHGGDPNNFSPDPECSTEEERTRHKAACEEWDRSGTNPNPAPHCAFMNRGTEPPGFGMGTNTFNDPVTEDWAERLDRILDRLERGGES